MQADVRDEAGLEAFHRALIARVKTDPVAALDHVWTHLTGLRQTQAMAAVLSAWTKTDPRAAWDWVNATSPGNVQFVDAVLSELGKTDFDLTRSFADDFARRFPDRARSTYVSALRGVLYAGNYANAAQWMANVRLDATAGASEAMGALIASEWGRYVPEDAAGWAQTLPEGSLRDQALLEVGRSWAVLDPAAAASFAAGLSEGDIRRSVVTDAVLNWLPKDPIRAARWLAGHEPNPDFDYAMGQLAILPETIHNNVNSAIRWANAITDKELRTRAIVKIMGTWAERDKYAAETYLRTTRSLPEELRAEVADRYRRGDLFGGDAPR